jgi:hypothetical protein
MGISPNQVRGIFKGLEKGDGAAFFENEARQRPRSIILACSALRTGVGPQGTR